MAGQSLRDLRSPLSMKYNLTHPGWVRFYKDYKMLILQNSTRVQITPMDMHVYEYRLTDYIRYMSYDPSLDAITLYINDMYTDMDFTNRTYILVPNEDYIKNLYTKWKTAQKNWDSI